MAHKNYAWIVKMNFQERNISCKGYEEKLTRPHLITCMVHFAVTNFSKQSPTYWRQSSNYRKRFCNEENVEWWRLFIHKWVRWSWNKIHICLVCLIVGIIYNIHRSIVNWIVVFIFNYKLYYLNPTFK